MARPLRILFEGAWYHVINRGAAKKTIFQNNKDRQIFLELLERIHHRYKIEIHAYCLMDNHYHLLVRTPLANISEAIKYLNGIYVQKHNALHKIDGPLFRGRFKSIVVGDDEYLLHLTRYIHLNPVEANICELPWEFPWSSCKNYIYKNNFTWLYVDPILSMFQTSDATKQYQGYLNFLCDTKINDKTLAKIKNSHPVIGSINFVSKVAEECLIAKPNYEEIPEKKWVVKVLLPSFPNTLKGLCKYFQIGEEIIFFTKRGKANLYRDILIYCGIEFCNMSLKELSNIFKSIKKTSISLIYRKMLIRISQDEILKNDIEKMMSNISKIEM